MAEASGASRPLQLVRLVRSKWSQSNVGRVMPTIRHAGVNDSLISRLHTNFQLTCKRNQNEPPQKSYAVGNCGNSSDACLPASVPVPVAVPVPVEVPVPFAVAVLSMRVPQSQFQLQLNVFITHGQHFRSPLRLLPVANFVLHFQFCGISFVQAATAGGHYPTYPLSHLLCNGAACVNYLMSPRIKCQLTPSVIYFQCN